MLVGPGGTQVVLPAQGGGKLHRLAAGQLQLLAGAHAQGREPGIPIILPTLERSSAAMFLEAVAGYMHIGQVGERLQRHARQCDLPGGLAEHLSALGIALALLAIADLVVLQLALGLDPVPAMAAAQAQAHLLQFLAGIGTQVVAIDAGRGMTTIAHAQRTVTVAGEDPDAGVLAHLPVNPQQHAANGTAIARPTGITLGLAPGPQGLDPQAVVLAFHGRRGGDALLTGSLAHGVAQLAAVVEQQVAHRRVDFPGQLIESLLGAAGIGRQQQALVDRVARAELFGGRGHRTLVGGQADTGERSGVTLHRQLHPAAGIGQATTEEQ
ncbi:hypothetical protein D9M71_329850 [compost metagenome]